MFFFGKTNWKFVFQILYSHHDNNRNIFIYWKKSSLEEKHWTYFIVIRKSGRWTGIYEQWVFSVVLGEYAVVAERRNHQAQGNRSPFLKTQFWFRSVMPIIRLVCKAVWVMNIKKWYSCNFFRVFWTFLPFFNNKSDKKAISVPIYQKLAKFLYSKKILKRI